MQPEYPFRRGDRIRVSVRSWSTLVNVLFVRVRYNDGTPDRRQISITHSAGDYSNELFFSEDPFLQDGYIESLTVDSLLEDREAYLAVFVDNEAELLHYCIFAGLLDVVHTPLGFFEHEDFSHTWVYEVDIINGDADGEVSAIIVPGAGNEFEVLYGTIFNGDSVNRVTEALVQDDDDNRIGWIMRAATVNAGHFIGFPIYGAGTTNRGGESNRWIISGGMKLKLSMAAVGATDDVNFAIACRIRGGSPTVTEAFTGSGGTITINKEQVFS